MRIPQNPLFNDPFFRRFFDIPEIPREQERQSLGSGVIVDAAKGYLLTNNHVIANADEEIVVELLTHPAAMLGLSDAGAHASQLCDAGFSTHLLGHWVRERGVLGLEAAIRLLTSRSAEVFGLRDRGRLAPGLAVDVVVFDPERVGCGPLRRVHDLPGGADRLVADARGVDAVIVNGVVLQGEGGCELDAEGPLPGCVLRGGKA